MGRLRGCDGVRGSGFRPYGSLTQKVGREDRIMADILAIKKLYIETERLRIVPMTYDFVKKLLDNDASAYEVLGAVKTETWPEKADIWDVLPMMASGLNKSPVPDGFNGAWLFINKTDNSVVGDGGYKGLPDENGVIDFGYGIVETQRQKGFGFEAVSALCKWGLAQPDVKGLSADCLENNMPSIKLLKKLGLQEVERKGGMIFFKTL